MPRGELTRPVWRDSMRSRCSGAWECSSGSPEPKQDQVRSPLPEAETALPGSGTRPGPGGRLDYSELVDAIATNSNPRSDAPNIHAPLYSTTFCLPTSC